MGTMLKLTLLGVTLGFLGERIYQFCHQTGFFKEVELIDLPNCQLVKGIEYGSEDIHLLPNGLAFISSGLKHPALKSFAPNKPAEILLVDLNNDVLHPKPLQLSEVIDASSFNPHGLSVYIDERDGTVYLFVVNHPIPDYNSCIEIFKFDEKKNYLLHLKTIKHPLLQRFIYAVDIMAHAIKVYEKHDNWSLTLVKAVDVDTCPDNLFVDPVTGDIWTGAHPNAYKVFFYKDEDPPLSEVIRIQKIHSDHPIVTRVYVNNGSVIQGSSIAVVYKKKLIIGTIFHKALYCQLD
ncbi:serum paraoxonase/arylesterase 1-like isoform X2 [Rana temporaria]|uniref:serum paraoxonase/arylesterase 1-like isoform X2 n=1 Tax=Rana temporaria TaxID=8407 RepID=UPI001AAD5EC0|nr:serum paraoxonase/arylesterase 1-like isoform X2 [Rana temporaria]